MLHEISQKGPERNVFGVIFLGKSSEGKLIGAEDDCELEMTVR